MNSIRMYRFRKPGFMKHQSEKLATLKRRQAIMIDAGINSNPKVLALHAKKDHALLGILLEIWLNLSADSETYETRADQFDHWARKTFSLGNRISIKDKLIRIQEEGLIEFEEATEESLSGFYSNPNGLLPESYSASTQGLFEPYSESNDSQNPIRKLKNGSMVEKIPTNKETKEKEENKHNELNSVLVSDDFLSSTKENQALAEQGMQYHATHFRTDESQSEWVKFFLTPIFQKIEEIQPDIPKNEILNVWENACVTAVYDKGLKPFEKNFLIGIFRNYLTQKYPSLPITLVPKTGQK